MYVLHAGSTHLRDRQLEDTELCDIINALKDPNTDGDNEKPSAFEMVNGVLTHVSGEETAKRLTVVPSSLHSQMLKSYHNESRHGDLLRTKVNL